MWTGIVVFEWRYHTRRLTFVVAAIVFAFMGFVVAATSYRAQQIDVNAPDAIAHSTGLLSLVSVFALTLFCAQSVLRDSEHQMAEIVYSTSLTKAQYVFGRFAGALMAGLTSFAFVFPGMLIGTYLVAHDPARIAPFDALDYLWPFAVVAVPNMVFVAALLFAVATLSRSTMATYVGGVLLYMLYFVASIFTNSPLMASSSPPTPESLAMAATADPFGLSAFFEQTHYWTVDERNTQRLVLGGYLLLNRVIWTGAALLVLGFVYRVFAFRLVAGARGEGADPTPRPVRSGYRPATVDATRPAAQWRAQWQALASATRSEIRQTLRSWPFAALLVAWAALNVIEVVEFFGHGEYATALLPTTGLVISRLQEPFVLFGLLVIVYFSAELVWRERAVRLHEIVDATPASSAVHMVSKTGALAVLVAVLATVAFGVAVIFQLSRDYTSLELGVYASALYFSGMPLVLVALLAIFIQTVSPNRYVGMLVTLVAVVVLHRGALGGPRHPLLRYAAAPEVAHSALNGFSPAATSFHWFMAYWTAVAGLVALVGYAVWRRGTDVRLLPRFAALPRRLRGAGRFAILACGSLALMTGASVFYQTNVLNAYETDEEIYDLRADYERAYRHLEDEAQPSVVGVEADVDLYPEERRYEVRGRYRLVNRTDELVDKVWVTVRRELTRVDLRLDGTAPTSHDERFAVYAFELDRPLAPGAESRLEFDVEVRRRGVRAGGADHDIVENGSFLLSPFLFPTLGYRQSRELRHPTERRRRGLEESVRPTTIEAAQAAGLSGGASDHVTFETTVSTVADQIAVAPGHLVESWQSDGRRYFRYAVDQPVMGYFGYVSARYAVERVRHRGVDVELYYHPGHDRNVGRFVEAMTLSLDAFTRSFGPYPYSHLRIVEIPSYAAGFAGLALAGTIYFVEDRGFLTDLDAGGRIDIVTKRVAHEVAHQWWGHQVSPSNDPGASLIVESLARYSELVVLAERYGEAAVRPALEVELDRYLRGRTSDAEVPLYQVQDQSWLYYAKGAVVMMAMRDLVGEEVLHRALRSLVAASGDPDDPPTSLDLLDRLYRVTPEERHELIDQWFRQIVVYDLRIGSAWYEKLADGRYRVNVEIEAAKSRIGDDEEEALAMDEGLEVAIYAQHPNGAGYDRPLYVGKHRIGGATRLSITVDERPEYAAVDPFLRRIDRHRTDNVGRIGIRMPDLPEPPQARSEIQ